MGRGLGRIQPPDWKHVEKYPVRAILSAIDKPTPVVLGIDWHPEFDFPVRYNDGYWVCRKSPPVKNSLGGHAICAESGVPNSAADSWQAFYDQGTTPHCVGYSTSYAMSLLNRKRYQAEWLYARCADIDGIPGDPGGTYTRCAGDILINEGHKSTAATIPHLADGISAYRWATNVDDILSVLKNPIATRRGAIPLLNSWGTYYPRRVWFPGETIQFLLDNYGEAMVLTDR